MKAILIVLLGICHLTIFAQEQVNFMWAKKLGGKGDELSPLMTNDKSGNIIMTGVFADTVDFDLGPGVFNLIASGTSDIFIAKYSNQGNLIWAKQLITFVGNEYPVTLSADQYDNIYLNARFKDSIECDPGTGVKYLYSKNYTSIGGNSTNASFILKLDKTGNYVFAKTLKATNSFAVDDTLNVYLVGDFADGDDINPDTGVLILTSTQNGKYGAFILKLDSTGAFVWVKSFDSKSVLISPIAYTSFKSISIDNDNSLIIYGNKTGNPFRYIQKGINYTTGTNDNYILKMDKLGNVIFFNETGVPANKQNSYTLSSGNLISTGSLLSTLDFDPGIGVYNLSSTGGDGIYFYKLNSNGQFVWAKGIGSENGIYSNAICTDKKGNIYTTGRFLGRGDFNSGPSINYLYAAGASDVYINKLDTNGNFIWAINLSGTKGEEGKGIFVDDSNYIYTMGNFYGVTDFDHGPGEYNLETNGGFDIYLHKIAPCEQADLSIQIAADSLISNQGNASYQWYDCYFDLPIIGETKKHLKPRSSGKYAIQITMGSCTYKSACIEYKSPSSDLLETNAQTAINLYPNPANASVKIQSNQIMQRIQIKDLQGKTILTEQVNDIHHEINTSGISNGIYMLETIGADGAISSNHRLCIVH
ncbi:MAG: T9SS type A sorting domain-containing protein [Chitinophagales bacterium]|nr:T9SS type A sorting domain-containing protein [Chitinophagales bacterium]